MGLEFKTLGVTYSSAASRICFSSFTHPAFHSTPGPGGPGIHQPRSSFRPSEGCTTLRLEECKLWAAESGAVFSAAAAAGGEPLLCRGIYKGMRFCFSILLFGCSCILSVNCHNSLDKSSTFSSTFLFFFLFFFCLVWTSLKAILKDAL